jgi:hypothetical protein
MAQRAEDALLRKLREAHAREAIDEHRSEVVAAVAVGIPRARREIERGLPADDVEDVRVSVRTRGARPPRDPRNASPVAEAARVIQHVPDRQRHAVVTHLRDVFADRIVERQFAVTREQQHCSRRELFRHRTCFEDRIGGIGHVVLEIGHAVRAQQHRRTVRRHTHGAARSGLRPPFEHLVHRGGASRRTLRLRDRGRHRAGDGHDCRCGHPEASH